MSHSAYNGAAVENEPMTEEATAVAQANPALVSRYQRLRKASRALNNKLLKAVPSEAMIQTTERLGRRKGKTIILEAEHEGDVLGDACLYDFRLDSLNTVQRYLRDRPPPQGSDERLLLEGMAAARYSIWKVKETMPGTGFWAEDTLREEDVFVYDIAFSSTATEG